MAEKTYTLNRHIAFALNHRKYLMDAVNFAKHEAETQSKDLGDVIESLVLEKFELLAEIEKLKSEIATLTKY